MSGLSLAVPVIYWITLALGIVSAALGVFAAVDAGSRRPDAFQAADRQTKGVWAGITIASASVFVLGLLVTYVLNSAAIFTPGTSLFWAAGMVGTLIYLVDVRPRLREAQRGSRW